MIIYLIRNKVNGKIYIGQTVESISKRFTRHCSECNLDGMVITKAIFKYGKENFTIEKIHECSSMEELNMMEEFYIKKYDTLSPNGYNIKSGGNNSRMHKSTKMKISRALRGKSKTKEHVEKVTKSRKEYYKNNPTELKKLGRGKGTHFDSSCRMKLSTSKTKSSKYVGVSRTKQGRYRCEFYYNGCKKIHYTFEEEILAAKCYDSLCIDHGLSPINLPNDLSSLDDIIIKSNKKPKKTSKFYGVSSRYNGAFQSKISYNGKTKTIGTFENEIDAAKAVDDFLISIGRPPKNFL